MKLTRTLFLSLLALGARAGALEVWANQVGFDSAGPKRFRVVAPLDYGKVPASFELLDSAGVVRHLGTASYQGFEWGRHFWLGEAGSFKTPGTYRIRAKLSTDTATSYSFEVGDDAPMRAAARAMVEFFFVQRCGGAVPLWHAACHTDDGKTPSGQRQDFSGGWHDAGEYQKYPGFFHPWATHSLLEAYERRRALFESMDVLTKNGVPDILEEAVWGAKFESKMTEANGHVWVRIVKVRSGSSWVTPEADTDRVTNTSDDRLVADHDSSSGPPPPNSQATLVAANLARLHRILKTRGGLPAPDPSWLPQAESIWSYYLTQTGGSLPYGAAEGNLLAAIELYLATSDVKYRTAADSAASALAAALINDPSLQDADFVGAGRGPAALAVYLERFPQGSSAAKARQAIVAALDHAVTNLWSNPVGLVKRSYYGQRVYFVGEAIAPDGWLRLGQNAGYGYTAYAAHLGAALTGDARYLQLAADQLDWILGANPQRWCMVHGIGKDHMKGYHHRYAWIPGHLDGAVPGTVPNGYARDKNALSADAPWVDTKANTETVIGPWRDIDVTSHVSNEPWLPNNAGVFLALASAPYTPASPPSPDAGVDAGPPPPADAGAADAGPADSGQPAVDAGNPGDVGAPDSGLPPAGSDAGTQPKERPSSAKDSSVLGGCGCSSAPLLPLALLFAAGVRRRRPGFGLAPGCARRAPKSKRGLTSGGAR
ncbi:MAG: glycoside hydrolase family 9 protein [Myxococcales bacterium]|nr:glycoside hydrolase family 9 protein [Myxococcales bacterium]